MTGDLPQVILVAFSPTINKEGGQIYKFELSSGIQIGTTYKEYSAPMERGPCTIAPFPPTASLDLSTSNLVALNTHNGAINYYQMDKGQPIHRYFGQEQISAIAVSPGVEGSLLMAAGNEQGLLLLWEIRTGELLSRIENAHYQQIDLIQFSMDGELLVSGSRDGSAKVWTVASLILGSLTPFLSLTEHSAAISDVCIGFGLGRNCRLLSASHDRTVRMYDLSDGQLLATITFPVAINSVRMNTIETLIFAGGIDGNIYLVDLQSDHSASLSYGSNFDLMMLKGHTSEIVGMSLSIDETFLVSGDRAGLVLVWNINSRQIFKRIECSKTDGHLSWLHVMTKNSLEQSESAHKLVVAPLKRALSSEHPVHATPLPQIAETLTSTCHHQLVTNEEMEQLRTGYLKLFDFVTSRLL